MPALVNISVGSFFITMGADGTMACDFDLKKSKNFKRISRDFIRTKFCVKFKVLACFGNNFYICVTLQQLPLPINEQK